MAEPPLTWRAFAAWQTRLLHLVHPDHRDAGLFLSLLGDSVHPHRTRRSRFRRLGLAHSVPGVGFPAGNLGLDPAAAQRIAVFQKMKDEGKGSKAPLTEAFANWSNAKIVILALIGGTMGQGVVWYTGQFYALFFLQSILKVDGYTANLLIAWSLLFGTGFFIVFGALSDKIGRKPIILAGCLIAALTFFPIFRMITTNANPALEKAIEATKVEVVADPQLRRSVQPGRHPRVQRAVRYRPRLPGAVFGQVLDRLRPGGIGREGHRQRQDVPYTDAKAGNPAVATAVAAAGYPKAGDAGIVKMSNPFVSSVRRCGADRILFILVIFVTMV